MNAATRTPNETVRQTALRLGRDPAYQFRRRMPQTAATPAAAGPSERPRRSIISSKWLWRVSLSLIALAVVATILAQLVGNRLARAGHSADPRLREIAVADDLLFVPANAIRFAGQRRRPQADRLDLYVHWPSMSGYSEELAEHFSGPGLDPTVLFMAIEPRQMRLDMSDRVTPLYEKFLIGAETDAGNGLKRRQLAPSAGFVGEDLLYEAKRERPYAARCSHASQPMAIAYCMRDIQIGRSLMVTYRFDRSLLADWRRLDAAIRQYTTSMLAERLSGLDHSSRSISSIAMEKL